MYLNEKISPIEHKLQLLKNINLWMIWILTPLTLISSYLINVKVIYKSLNTLFSLFVIFTTFKYGTLKIIFSNSVWKTQNIVLESSHNSNHKIEYQLQDIGALGYNKRTVEIKYISKYFYIIIKEEVDFSEYNTKEWNRVNINLNESNLKGG